MFNRTKTIMPLVGKSSMLPRRTFIIATFDIETIPLKPGESALDGKLALITYCDPYGNIDSCTTMNRFLHIILSYPENVLRKTIWFSHNGEYDWRYLIASFRNFTKDYDITCCERMEGKLFQLAIKGKTIKIMTKFRDSMAVFPRSLEEFAAAFSPNTPKGHINWDEETFNRKNPVHFKYALNDSRCLAEAMKNYDQFIYDNFQVHLAGTAASTSYQAWLRTQSKDKPRWRISKSADELIRKAYIGGMVQLNAHYLKSYYGIYAYDINSSYPASMRAGVPTGEPLLTFRYQADKPGFYKILFRTPSKNFIMPILANKNEKGLLAFPNNVGLSRIEGYATSLEIDYARSLGYEIDIDYGYVFPQIEDIFSNYIDKCETLREKYKGQPTEQAIKLMQNSLYGRFGMRPEGREVIICYDDPGEDWGCVLAETGEDEELVILPDVYYRENERQTEFMMPHWSAWITAGARIRLDIGSRAVGIENVRYRDTDAIYIEGEAPPGTLDIDSCLYGAWKFESFYQEVRIHAPKFYTGKLSSGNWFLKCKGMPRKKMTADIIKRLHSGEEYERVWHRSLSLQSSLKKGKLWEQARRRPTNPANIYSHILEEGLFKAVRL